MSLYLVKIRNIENRRNPFAIIIIIHPRYLDKNVWSSKKNDSEIEEFNETTVVTIDISNIDKINLGKLILFMIVIKLRLVKHNYI